jgi:hypothetical protein
LALTGCGKIQCWQQVVEIEKVILSQVVENRPAKQVFTPILPG